MTAVLLGWDPVWPEAWQPDYARAAACSRETGIFRAVWDISGCPDLEPGSDAWFLLAGTGTGGVTGHGVIVSYPYGLADELSEPGITLVDLDIDLLLPLGEPVPLSELAGLEGAGAGTGADVTVLPSGPADALRAAWAARIGAVPSRPASPASPVPGTLPQHALRWSLANRYENDPDAARICLVHHGPVCSACGFDFAAVFGSEAALLMQVHHVVPPRLLHDGYELDPVADLVPLCPNCHAMSHSATPDPYTPAELRHRLRAGGGAVTPQEVPGAVLSREQLQAADDAERLLRTRWPRPD